MKGMISILESNLKFAKIHIYARDFAHIIWLCERPLRLLDWLSRQNIGLKTIGLHLYLVGH